MSQCEPGQPLHRRSAFVTALLITSLTGSHLLRNSYLWITFSFSYRQHALVYKGFSVVALVVGTFDEYIGLSIHEDSTLFLTFLFYVNLCGISYRGFSSQPLVRSLALCSRHGGRVKFLPYRILGTYAHNIEKLVPFLLSILET